GGGVHRGHVAIHSNRGDGDRGRDAVQVGAREIAALRPPGLVPGIRDDDLVGEGAADASPQDVDGGGEGHTTAQVEVRLAGRALHEMGVGVDEARDDDLPTELDELRLLPRPRLRLRVRPHREDPPAPEGDHLCQRLLGVHRVGRPVHEDEVRLAYGAGLSFRRRVAASWRVSSRFENMNRTYRLPSAGSEKKELPGTTATPISSTRWRVNAQSSA